MHNPLANLNDIRCEAEDLNGNIMENLRGVRGLGGIGDGIGVTNFNTLGPDHSQGFFGGDRTRNLMEGFDNKLDKSVDRLDQLPYPMDRVG